jgi:hypothetical protein
VWGSLCLYVIRTRPDRQLTGGTDRVGGVDAEVDEGAPVGSPVAEFRAEAHAPMTTSMEALASPAAVDLIPDRRESRPIVRSLPRNRPLDVPGRPVVPVDRFPLLRSIRRRMICS